MELDSTEEIKSAVEAISAGTAFMGLRTRSRCSSRPHIERPEELGDRSFEPGKNWSWC
jgi:hypothetical protein